VNTRLLRAGYSPHFFLKCFCWVAGNVRVSLYRKRLDAVYFFDNAGRKPQLIFFEEDGLLTVCNRSLYERIISEVEKWS